MQKRILRSAKGMPMHERKRRQWMQIELAGRVGFSATRHNRILEEKLVPLAPKVLTLIMAGQKSDARKAIAPVAAKLAATFALMALKVRNKTKRQRLYNWAVRITEENCNKREWMPNNMEIDELVNVCGSPESADEFWENFSFNCQEIFTESAKILRREAKRHGLRQD